MVPLTRRQGPLLRRRRAPAEHQDAVWDCQDRSGNITTFPPYPPRQYQAQAGTGRIGHMPPPEPEGLGLGELALACAQQTSVWAIQQLGTPSLG